MRSPLRYLAATDVIAAMPSVADRLDLAERTMTALVADAELPPKIGVHPRPAGSFAHAMPAALRPLAASDAGDELLGIKWVTGFPDNRALGLPAIHAIVVLSDPTTGEPRAILDGGPITAERTAAVSGVAIARFGPRAAATMGAASSATVTNRRSIRMTVSRQSAASPSLVDHERRSCRLQRSHCKSGQPSARQTTSELVM